jgi:hypothetical protein
MEDGSKYTMNADVTEIRPCEEDNDDQNSENNSSAGEVMAGTLVISGMLFADDFTVFGIADDAAIPALLVAGSITAGVMWLHNQFASDHEKNARPSTKGKHQKGEARKIQGRQGSKGEKLPPRKRPPDWQGPWPPSNK